MVTLPRSIQFFLDEHEIAYEIYVHRPDYTAQETAEHTHTPGSAFAKTVLLWIDGNYAMAVLPAHHRIHVAKLRRALGAKEITLASEYELHELCPDCDVGAMPPFGNLYGLPVYVSAALEQNRQISFNAGSHVEVMRIDYADFKQLVHPIVLDFSTLAE